MRAVVNKELTVIVKDEKCIILNMSGDVVGSGQKDGKLFIPDCKMIDNESHQVHSAIGEKSAKLWHQRFGHISMKNLKIQRDEKLVTGLNANNSNDMNVCKGCVKGKQKKHFPEMKLHVYLNCWVQCTVMFVDPCRQIVLVVIGMFIDDKSRFVAVYFMKSKDQVLQKFKEYEAMVTNVTGKKIKVFRSDNGGEYNSREIDEFLNSKGIVKQRSIPSKP